jgi:predicted dehydrogenase
MPRFLVEETAVHWIDTFRFLLGDPVSVYADLRRLNPSIAGEDAGLILFDYAGGLRALFDGNRHLDHASDNLRRTMGDALLEGEAGVLSLHGDGRVDLRRFGSIAAETLLAPDRWDGFGGDCVHALQSHVVAALRHGKTPENSARDYLSVLRTRDAVYRSAETGRKVAL